MILCSPLSQDSSGGDVLGVINSQFVTDLLGSLHSNVLVVMRKSGR